MPDANGRRWALSRPYAFDAATLSVIAIGLALALCWPHAASRYSLREAASTQISYAQISPAELDVVREPLLFLPLVSDAVLSLDEDMGALYSAYSAARPRASVALPTPHGPSAMFSLNSALQRSAPPEHARYVPKGSPRLVFGETPALPQGVQIELSHVLKACRFDWSLTDAEVPAPEGRSDYRAVFEVVGRKASHPEYVFVIESSGDSELDQWFVRRLYGASVAQPRDQWRGRVTVLRQAPRSRETSE